MKQLVIAVFILIVTLNHSQLLALDLTAWQLETELLGQSLAHTCNQLRSEPNNLVWTELFLQELANQNYLQLLTTDFRQKQQLVHDFYDQFCHPHPELIGGPIGDLSAYLAGINQIKASATNLLFGESGHDLVKIEYFLGQILKQSYLDLMTTAMTLGVKNKWGLFEQSLQQLMGLETMPSAKKTSSPPVYHGAGTGAGGGEGAAESKSFNRDDFSLSQLTGHQDLPVNRVGLYDQPLIGKYFGAAGYPMAQTELLINNGIVNPGLLDMYPAEIQAVIPDGFLVTFYTQILVWKKNDNELPKSFADKDRCFNLVFHGTMLSWFDEKYNTYDFKTQAISENLDMGIFQPNGIARVAAIGLDRLESQPVSPHDNHFSPDNAQFYVMPDRNLITLWSVVKSNEKRRAMVTFHVLINGDHYDFQADLVKMACLNTNSLSTFLEQIKAEALAFLGPDDIAWQQAIAFLQELYG